jgi:site-specific recombinase
MAALLQLAAGSGDGFALAVELVRGSATQHSVRGLLRNTLRQLALKVVEHTAHTGEHYIANTRAEWWAMLKSASGGGLLTAVTAFVKYGVVALPLAPALLGGAHALNYSLSFIALQFLGFSLASKQPSMTGSALADALDQKQGLGAEIDLVASIARTQLIAAVGNVFAAIPGALLLDLLWRLVTGHPLLTAEEGHHGLADLHPFTSLTLPFAAITGVFLWLSSLAAGLSANWSAFRSLPRAVGRSPRIVALLGDRRARWLGVQVGRHFSGIAAYVVLGFLLGFVPVLFKFAGVGLEVRHVTLSSASLALDASALLSAGELHTGALLWASLGIVFIGALNFGVSFALGLRVALQARGLVAVDRRRLVRGILRAMVRRPGRFLLPPKAEQGEPEGA